MSRLLLVLIAWSLFAGLPAGAMEQEHPRAADDLPEPPGTPVASPATGMAGDVRGIPALPLEGARHQALAAFVEETMALCPVPGASVAVVQGGDVVFLQGFGVREIGGAEPVTPETLLRVGSVTKSLTTLLAAVLVDDGLLAWDTPVAWVLPEFALANPALAERLTIADLFSAGSGLPRSDLEIIFEADQYSPAGLLAAVERLPLAAAPGERYQYSNQAFAIGGYAAAAADGAAPGEPRRGYERAMQHRVLNPLGMERSAFSLESVLRSGDYAAPHAPGLDGATRPVSLLMEERFMQAVTPAGALWTSASDMAAYLQMLLADGVAADGTRVVSEQNLQRLWRPGVTVPPNPQLPPLINAGMTHYGLGWYIGEYGGLDLISHSGGTYGFASEVAILPEAGLGVAVLANDAICGAILSYGTQYRLFELVFDQEPAVATEVAAFVGAIDAQRQAASALLRPVDPDVARAVAGEYLHPELGTIQVRADGDYLLIDAGEMRSRFAPMHIPLISPVRYVPLDPPLAGSPGWFTFEPGTDGRMTTVLTMTPEPWLDPVDYRFEPVPLPA